MPEGVDQAAEAFAQEIAPQSRPRDQAGRFVPANKAPEPFLQPRPLEGDERGDTRDGGADPRLEQHERSVANGWTEPGQEPRSDDGRQRRSRDPARWEADDGLRQTEPADGLGVRPDGDAGATQSARQARRDDERQQQEAEPERIGAEEADDAGSDNAQSDEARKDAEGADAERQPESDPGPRYKVQVDGEEKEVTLSEALKGYVSGETFTQRMGQLVDVAKAIDQRGQEAVQARDAYIAMCQRQEQEFQALIPKEPGNWDELYRSNPQAAHELEKNFRFVYGTLNEIRSRRAAAESQAYTENVKRTADYAKSEFNKFCSRNKLTNQVEADRAIGHMRRTAMAHGFSEDEVGTTYDERMLSVLLKAAKYDNMMANKPLAVQPDRGLHPGSAQRVGNGAARTMNDAQRRLASSGRLDDAALVMAQLIRR
jgi:hypothetical protein